jgi:REP element-mobilizing transposase RayT
MPEPTPLQHGKYYHIFNRGNNREDIFTEERNYRYFLKLYAKHITPVADTYAYCLLRNHFHFLVRIKAVDELDPGSQNLSKVAREPSQRFSNLFNAYAKAINRAYHRTGALFQRPFGRVEVMTDAYFEYLVTYIHRNPQKHGFVDDFRAWPYSSYHALLSSQPTRLQRDEVLSWFQGVDHFENVHRYEVDERKIAPLIYGDLTQT